MRSRGERVRNNALHGSSRDSAAPAAYYETYWSPTGFCPRGVLIPELIATLEAHVPPGSRCLDIGCGDGRTTGRWLRDRGCEYVGVDISASAVAHARSEGLDARQIEDATALPFSDATFDFGVCVEVLEHLFQPQIAAAEILRVLKPGGTLIVTVPNVAYWRRRAELAFLGHWNPMGDEFAAEQPWRDPHIRFFNPASLRRMLTMLGFRPVRVTGHDGSFLHDLPWIGRRFRDARSNGLYRLGEKAFPSLLAYRLYAVAGKPSPLA